jgi:hypothetical protein
MKSNTIKSMLRSPFSQVSVNPHRRPGSLISGLYSASVQRPFQLLEREWSTVKPAAEFALQLTVGLAAAAGTILALFAWNGAGL